MKAPPNPEAEQPGCGGPADICEQNVEEHKQSGQDSVKSKKEHSQNLLVLRGLVNQIDGFLYVHCPICDSVHRHQWAHPPCYKLDGTTPEVTEAVVKAGCGDKNPFVKHYRVGLYKQRHLAGLRAWAGRHTQKEQNNLHQRAATNRQLAHNNCWEVR
jgi:hypothetical protein